MVQYAQLVRISIMCQHRLIGSEVYVDEIVLYVIM